MSLKLSWSNLNLAYHLHYLGGKYGRQTLEDGNDHRWLSQAFFHPFVFLQNSFIHIFVQRPWINRTVPRTFIVYRVPHLHSWGMLGQCKALILLFKNYRQRMRWILMRSNSLRTLVGGEAARHPVMLTAAGRQWPAHVCSAVWYPHSVETFPMSHTLKRKLHRPMTFSGFDKTYVIFINTAWRGSPKNIHLEAVLALMIGH